MDNFVYWIARTTIAVIRIPPLKVCFVLGQALGALLWCILPGYRRLAKENISRAFQNEKSPAEIRSLTFSHFIQMGANFLTALKMATMPEETVRHRVAIEGIDIIKAELAKQKGVIVAINHIGNWELLAQLISLVHPIPVGTVYQPLRNKAINRLIDEDRRRRGVKTFDRSKGFTKAIAMLRQGGVLGILVDQSAGKSGLWTPFFNRMCSTSPLTASLAMGTGAAVIPVAIYTTGIAQWRLCFRSPISYDHQEPDRLTYDINCALEQQIRTSPADWFWVHDRWKTPWPDVGLVQYKRGIYFPKVYDFASLQPYRILVRSSNWLGDAVMGIPMVRALKHSRPDAKMTILTKAKLVDLWRAVPEVDYVISITPKDSFLTTARKIRDQFDVAFLLPNSFRSALEVWWAGIPRRIGFKGHGRRKLLTQFPDEKRKRFQMLHQKDHYLSLALWVAAPEVSHANALGDWKPLRKDRIGICPGAEFGPSKRWLPDRFAKVVTLLDQKQPRTWVIIGVSNDIPIAKQIMDFAPQANFENLVGKTSLAELIEVLRGLDGIITNDTGTMHLAAMLGVPTLGIFGSTDPYRTGPIGPRATFLYRQVECSPCFLRECPIDMRCMKAIQAEEAAEALDILIEKYR